MKKFLGGNRSSALYSKGFEMGKWQNIFFIMEGCPFRRRALGGGGGGSPR